MQPHTPFRRGQTSKEEINYSSAVAQHIQAATVEQKPCSNNCCRHPAATGATSKLWQGLIIFLTLFFSFQQTAVKNAVDILGKKALVRAHKSKHLIHRLLQWLHPSSLNQPQVKCTLCWPPSPMTRLPAVSASCRHSNGVGFANTMPWGCRADTCCQTYACSMHGTQQPALCSADEATTTKQPH